MKISNFLSGLFIFLLGFLSLSAIVVGVMLILSPQGSEIEMPIELLDNSPFKNFLVPGIILLVTFGLIPIYIIYALIKRPENRFMAHNDLFIKKGFEIVGSAEPDFNLLALKFNSESITPGFKSDALKNVDDYKDGLTIMRSPQCPYTEKNVNAIMETAKTKFQMKTRLIDLQDAESTQKGPCAFGTFCIIYNGKIISYHPISNRRFENIMAKIVV